MEMELFLLFVILILLIIFHSVKNSKLRKVEDKLKNIEDYLRQVQLYQSRKEADAQSGVTVTPTVVEPAVKPVEDKIVPEIIIAPVIPPVVNIPPVIEPENVPLDVPEVILIDETVPQIPTVETITEQQIVEPRKPVTPYVPEQSWYDRFRENNPDLEKFIGENILSKVAITILVIGIAFFVKYAIDKEWINEIARVGIGILCGGIVLGFAHRLRLNFKAFSSVLVAGGIAIFYFTIGIAFHQYHLFNQTTAFLLMLVITSFSVFISVMYNRQELAVLSLIGGFSTPFMVSTGEGNYLVLFIYILILDAGMLVLAYLRKWNLLNILSYAFTMILYFGWLQSKVIGEPGAPYKGAFIFAAIFYVVFIIMSMINNIKEKRNFGAIDLSILISNTFLFYGAGMQILSHYHTELQGLFSLTMAIFNLVCSWLLYKKFKADQKLVYLMIGLTLTFITLVAPVQLHGNYITIFWALEAVLLIWLAQKSNIVMYRFASAIITVLMSLSLFIDWTQVYMAHTDIPSAILLNKGFITGLVCAFSFLATSLLLKKETEVVKFAGIGFNPVNYSRFMQGAFVVLLYVVGMLELFYQLNRYIYYGTTIAIIIGAYHFIYFLLLNVVSANKEGKFIQGTMFLLNYINAILFVVVFAIMPYIDFKENVSQMDQGYLGFIFHYVSLFCFVAFLFFMRRMLLKPDAGIAPNKALHTILISVAIIYLGSVELLLHISQIAVSGVVSNTDADRWAKADEIASVTKHVVKIGFPILWGLLAFVFLFIGMKKQNKTLRITSLLLIAMILIKLFGFDIQDASEAGKIVAFIILGVVLLIISFMYQKIKKLIIDERNETPENSNGDADKTE